jgi:DNA-binding MarR family transcriptional regulator
MGKRSRDKDRKKERRRAEAAALARSTWLAQSLGQERSPDEPSTELKIRESRLPARRTKAPKADPEMSRARQIVGPDGSLRPGVPRDLTARESAPVASDAAPLPGGLEASPGVPALSPAGPAAEPGAAAPPPDALRPRVDATELAARLAGLSTVLQRELGRADVGDGLTRARLSALSLLVLGGPRTLGDLAAAEHVRPPTMTRLVHAMEADGLVARERHPSDGRSIVIRATASGEVLLEQGRARRIASLARVFERLEPAEQARLEDAADLLGRVLRTSGRGVGDPSA